MALPTKDEFGRPLGYRNGNWWIWLPKRRDFKVKRRSFDTYDGKHVTASMLPYTYGVFTRHAEGPRGGKALQEHYRNLWYHDGTVYYLHKMMPTDEDKRGGSWPRVLMPYSGKIWNPYDADEPSFDLRDGKLVGIAA